MGTFETIGFVFDIATVISVIGAVIIFIYSTRRENKKQLQNEKVIKILDILEEFRIEHLDRLFKKINIYNDPNFGPLLTDTAEFLRVKMLPVFAIFATKENIDELEKMMDATDKAINAWGDFCLVDKDANANAHDTVNKAMIEYSRSMRELDSQLTENLRNQVHNENKTKSKQIAKLYQKLKYTDRKVRFKST